MPRPADLRGFIVAVTAIAAIAAVGLSGCGGSDGIEGLRRYGAVENDHAHVQVAVDYPDRPRPPVRGPHFPRWLRCDVYDDPVPDELAVHSLEHGAVWITYSSEVRENGVDRLRELAEEEPDYVIVSPYPRQPGRVEATAWGVQLTVRRPRDPRLADFVEKYAGGGQGGEGGADCRQQGLTPQQGFRLLDRTPPTVPDPAEAETGPGEGPSTTTTADPSAPTTVGPPLPD